MARYSEGSVYRGREGTGGAQVFSPTDLSAMGKAKGAAIQKKREDEQKAASKYKPDDLRLKPGENLLPEASQSYTNVTIAIGEELSRYNLLERNNNLSDEDRVRADMLSLMYSSYTGSLNNAESMRSDVLKTIKENEASYVMSGEEEGLATFGRAEEYVDKLLSPLTSKSENQMRNSYGDEWVDMLKSRFGDDIVSNDPIKRAAAQTQYIDKYYMTKALTLGGVSPKNMEDMESHWMGIIKNQAVKTGADWAKQEGFNIKNTDVLARDTSEYVDKDRLSMVIDDQWTTMNDIDKYVYFDNDKDNFISKMESLTQPYQSTEDLKVVTQRGGSGWVNPPEIDEDRVAYTDVSMQTTAGGSLSTQTASISIPATQSVKDFNLTSSHAMLVMDEHGNEVGESYSQVGAISLVPMVKFDEDDVIPSKIKNEGRSILGIKNTGDLYNGVTLDNRKLKKLVDGGFVSMDNVYFVPVGTGKSVDKTRYLEKEERDGDTYQFKTEEMNSFTATPIKDLSLDGILDQYSRSFSGSKNAGEIRGSVERLLKWDEQRRVLEENGWSESQIIEYRNARNDWFGGSQTSTQSTDEQDNTGSGSFDNF